MAESRPEPEIVLHVCTVAADSDTSEASGVGGWDSAGVEPSDSLDHPDGAEDEAESYRPGLVPALLAWVGVTAALVLLTLAYIGGSGAAHTQVRLLVVSALVVGIVALISMLSSRR